MADPTLALPVPFRWTPQRKAALVLAIRQGQTSRHEALETYGLSEDELSSWESSWAQAGLPSLRTGYARTQPTTIQDHLQAAAPWKSTAAPSSLTELSAWFDSQVELIHALAEGYAREARLRLQLGDREWALSLVDLAQTMTTQARSYEHASRLCADLGGDPR